MGHEEGPLDCQAKQPVSSAGNAMIRAVRVCTPQVSLTSSGGEKTHLLCSFSPSSGPVGWTPVCEDRD